MLNILYGDVGENEPQNFIRFPQNDFNSLYKPDWFEDDFVKKIVKEVDRSEVIFPEVVMSPVFGAIPVVKLSGGAKALILVYKRPDLLCDCTTCGDNCAPLFLEMAKDRDVTINIAYLMEFQDPFDIRVLNNDKVCHTWKDLLFTALDYTR